LIKPPVVVLSIAGSDNSAGAGIQADLKSITALGGYGLTAVTCVVAEIPGRVDAIQAVWASIVADQVRLSFDAFPVAAVKTGMLYSTAIIRRTVDTLLAARTARGPRPALVVDPVMVASSGDLLLKRDAVAAYRKYLIPIATLVTPNLDELAILAQCKISDVDSMIRAGERLVEEYGTAFLLKGGHLRGNVALDVLVAPGGLQAEYSTPVVKGVDPHGTGCTYSAAIATCLAQGDGLREAVGRAKHFITSAIRQRHRFSKSSVLNHDPDLTGGDPVKRRG
jgi:hydroxymethylpyrimidine/phosphomethylpyrimidine kinase